MFVILLFNVHLTYDAPVFGGSLQAYS